MARLAEIEGDSDAAVALELLQIVARAEGKLAADGTIEGTRAWVLDTYAECLLAVLGERKAADEDDETDEEEDDADEKRE
jgi:hypothetical protein